MDNIRTAELHNTLAPKIVKMIVQRPVLLEVRASTRW